ncbi:MAG: tetratricopeptide repeat protein [Flavobacteriales bacterium]|nr:tetratricopeptide repeat protein [Flavobacteriales bacterium]
MNRFYLILILIFPTFLSANHQLAIDSCYMELNKLSEKDSNYANILNVIGFSYIYVNLDSAKSVAQKAVDLSHQNNFDYGVAYGHRTLGSIELIQGHYKEAKEIYVEGLEFAESRNRILINNMIAACDIQFKDFDNALQYLLESLELLESVEDSAISANTYFYLAMVYEYQNKAEKAIDYYEKTLAIKKGLKDQKGIANSLLNLGNCYKEVGNYDKALESNIEAKNIYEELKLTNKVATAMTNMAGLYSDQGNETKAKQYLHQVLELVNKDESKSLYSSILHSLANSYYKTKNYKEALRHANSSLELAEVTKAPHLLIPCYELLADIHSAQGTYSEAYKFSNIRNSMKDSLDHATNQAIIEEMQAKFESEEKEKEIVLLSQENQIQGLTLSKTKLTRNITILCAIAFIIISLVLFNRFKIKKKANLLLQEKNQIIQIQKERITDSINYAKTIQESIFLPEEEIQKYFSDLFIYYKPKDIVSGDFYWFANIDGKCIVAAADCTGHGVPGAFMSMMGHSILNDIVNSQKITSPARILEKLHENVKENLKQNLGTDRAQDGMDVTICSIDYNNNKLTFAGANNNALLVRQNEMVTMKGCFKGIGGSFAFKKEKNQERTFLNHEYDISEGDMIYMYSDGYLDQFGGEKRKKFSTRKFKEMIGSHQLLSMKDQKEKLIGIMNGWMSDYEQLDDQMVIGIKV